MHLSCVFDIVVLGACFLLENVFSQFFIFNIRISKSLESTKININLMFFQAKHTFKTHLNSFPNAKTNGIESVGLYEKRWLNNFYCHFTGPCSYPIDR